MAVQQYTLIVQIEQDLVTKLNQGAYFLCFARGVADLGTPDAADLGTPDPAYSVIATCDEVADTVTIMWTEAYQMGASSESFSNGAHFTLKTDLLDIAFDQQFNLPEFWDPISVTSAQPPVGAGQFVFNNAGTQGKPGPQASCVIYQSINGTSQPIYISPKGALLPGRDVLEPVSRVAVWFQQNASSGTMISDAETLGIVVDYTGTTTHTVSYNDPGVWSLVSKEST